jgi:hypothetical protein
MGTPILAFIVSLQDTQMKKKISAALITSSLVASTLIVFLTGGHESKSDCRIQVSIPHVSTSISERFGLKAVKVNAFSTCNRPHERITLVVQIWKENLVFKELLISHVEREPKLMPAGKRFYNESTFVPCLNSQMTKYYGVAYGKAMINGKWYFANHKLDIVIPPIPCGT